MWQEVAYKIDEKGLCSRPWRTVRKLDPLITLASPWTWSREATDAAYDEIWKCGALRIGLWDKWTKLLRNCELNRELVWACRSWVCPYRWWSCHSVTSLDEVTDFGQLIPELDHCTLFIVERNVLLSMLHRRPSSEPVFLYFLSLEQIQRKIALRYYTHYLSVNSNRSPVLQ